MIKQLPPEILAIIFDFITYQKRDSLYHYFYSTSLELPLWKCQESRQPTIICDTAEAFRAVVNRGGNLLLFFFRALEFYFFTERELTVQAYFTYRSFEFMERKLDWTHLNGRDHINKKNQYNDKLINMLANKG